MWSVSGPSHWKPSMKFNICRSSFMWVSLSHFMIRYKSAVCRGAVCWSSLMTHKSRPDDELEEVPMSAALSICKQHPTSHNGPTSAPFTRRVFVWYWSPWKRARPDHVTFIWRCRPRYWANVIIDVFYNKVQRFVIHCLAVIKHLDQWFPKLGLGVLRVTVRGPQGFCV